MKLTLKHVLAAIVLSSSFAAQAAVDQAEDASAAYDRGDYATAHRLLHPLAEQGDANAQLILGGMYYDGLGVPQDYAEAVRWYRLVADQGLAHAQDNLGFLYANGLGVSQDYVRAHMWSNLSAVQDDETALVYRDLYAQRMTPEQIAEAQRLAREWRPTTQPPQ